MKSEDKNYKQKYEELKNEYSDYAYIVSHDLNAPVRHVKEFTKLLCKELERHMNEDCVEYKYYIDKSVHVLEDKLAAMLKISRINTEKWHYVTLDCKEVIESAVRQAQKDYNFDFTIEGNFPSLNIDPENFQTAFYNIIENSAKFYTGSNAPVINISCHTGPELSTFKIRDNGIGMRPNKIETAFQMFRKLEPKYKGVGAGLTVSKKIIQRFGGDITITSEPEKGTEVTVSIPRKVIST